MNRLYQIIATIFIVGCASETQIIERNPVGGDSGAAGAPPETGGNSGVGNSNSGGTGNSSTGGSGNVNSGGSGNNAGGQAGDMGVGGNNVGGSGGGPCIPKTCDTYSFEQTGEANRACGVIPDDGCGNVLNCGNCQNPWEKCGGGETIQHQPGQMEFPDPVLADESKAIPNICNGNCALSHDSVAEDTRYCNAGDRTNGTLVTCPYGAPADGGPGAITPPDGSQDWRPTPFIGISEQFAYCNMTGKIGAMWCCFY